VSLLAPFTAALAGATAAELRRGDAWARIVAPFAIAAGVVVELVVIHDAGNLGWVTPVLLVAAAGSATTLAVVADHRIRSAAVATFLAAALVGPAIWSVQTLGHATNGTFPAGGPATAGFGGGGGPGGGGPPNGGGGFRGGQGAPQLPQQPGAGNGGGGFGRRGGSGGGPGGGGGMFGGNADLQQVLAYTESQGGGTIAVASQSGASNAIISSGADVAGIGGFSGRESTPSVDWFAQEVRDGNISWVLTGGQMGGMRDGREGSTDVMTAVANVCTAVPSSAYGTDSGSSDFGGTSSSGLYDCRGKADALADALA
jgi:hypothetical protein